MKIKSILFIATLLCGTNIQQNAFAVSAVASNLTTPTNVPAEIQKIMDQPMYQGSRWGMLVVDVDSGKPVYELNADELFYPASVTKIFTAASALKYLGPNYKDYSHVYTNGKIDANGTLRGDLFLVLAPDIFMHNYYPHNGGMTYTLLTDHITNKKVIETSNPLASLQDLANQIAQKGIKQIEGDIIIDDRVFSGQTKSTAIDYEGASSISINDNAIDFIITPADKIGQPAHLTFMPKNAFYKIKANITTVPSSKTTSINIEDTKGNNTIEISGQISINEKPLIKSYDVKNPKAFAQALFAEALQNAKIKINNQNRASTIPTNKLPQKNDYQKGFMPIATLASFPLHEDVKIILKVSHNEGANSLLLKMAAKANKKTVIDAIALENAILNKLNLDTSHISINDGSGGLIGNLISPRAIVSLLLNIKKDAIFPFFYDALPILGIDGTLSDAINPDSPARGKVFAKTGTALLGSMLHNKSTFLDAKALAGYIKIDNKVKLAFAIVVNNAVYARMPNEMLLLKKVTSDFGKIAELIYLNNLPQ